MPTITALQVGNQDQLQAPLPRELTIESAADIERLRDQGSLPSVLIVAGEKLDLFRRYEECVVDRGRKHPRKGLAAILLGHDRTTIVDATHYRKVGRILQGIRGFFTEANLKADHNCHVVGVADPLLQELLNRAVDSGKGSKIMSAAMPGNAPPDVAPNKRSLQDELLRLMGPAEVPATLAMSYLGISRDADLIRQLILAASQTDYPVLVQGDTGTGKEIIAQQIHSCGNKPMSRFVAVNCGAISPAIFESELFGHVKGAFSGALQDKKGLWEAAQDGTLFLDEIGDLSLDHQVKILRSLQEEKIRRVGDTKDISVKARIVCATNRNLHALVKTGQFREDLYYRIRGFLIYTSPLRDHALDIPVIVAALWEKITEKYTASTVSPAVVDRLMRWSWPGNVRELRMVLTNIHAHFPKVKVIEVQHLEAIFLLQGQPTATQQASKPLDRNLFAVMKSLQHLAKAHECFQTTRKELTEDFAGAAAHDALPVESRKRLRMRLHELDLLCNEPLRFHSPETLDRVASLRAGLSFLQGLLEEDADAARAYWDKRMPPLFIETMTVVQQAIDDIHRRNF